MAKLFCVYILLVIASQSHGFQFWNNLRATWSMPMGPIEKFRYDELPRTHVDAIKQGWKQITAANNCNNDGAFNGFRWMHPEDSGIALLFDHHGNVGGLQALLPHKEIISDDNFFEYGEVPMYQNTTLNGIDYFVITAYFTQPENLCYGGDYQAGNIGVRSQLYFQNGYGPHKLKIGYKHRYEASAHGWSVNDCVPGMGWHNFFEVEKIADHNCKRIQPTCLLFDEKNEMIGFCLSFNGVGKSKSYEHPDKYGVGATIGPMAPKCLLDNVEKYGTTTIHIYFGSAPWKQTCKR